MAIVARVRTPIGAREAAEGLRRAFAALGGQLSDAMASLLLSQLWLETGRGKNAFNYNWGNLQASAAWPGDKWPAPWLDLNAVEALPEAAQRERYRKLHYDALAGKQPSYFRAYPTAAAGFGDYAALLNKPRFSPLLYAAATGDPTAFATQIKDTGYAPAIDVTATAKTLASLQHELLPSVVPVATNVVAGSAALLVAGLAAAGAAWALTR
jgi:hypothetical protein